MNLLKMLNDSFYEDGDYYWDSKSTTDSHHTKNGTGKEERPSFTTASCVVNNSSSSLLVSSCVSSNSSLQGDTSTSTFLSLPLKPVQSSSPNSKTSSSNDYNNGQLLPHLLSEGFTNSSSSSDYSPPNSSFTDDYYYRRSSVSLSSSYLSNSSSFSPPANRRQQKKPRNLSQPGLMPSGKINDRIKRSKSNRYSRSEFVTHRQKSNFISVENNYNNQCVGKSELLLLPPLNTSSSSVEEANLRRTKILQLIERTKQRRERLKKIETDLTVRKRRPLTEDNSVNIEQPLEDESPKRQCLREEEHNIKPDTPAIRSVRSRRADITIISQTSNTEEEYVPVPVPRKSLSHEENHNPNPDNFKPERQSRFAKLAQTINSWDDDYSYHTISKANEGSLSSEQMRDTGSILRSKSPAPTAPQSPISSRSKSPAPLAPGSASRSKSPAPLAPGSASRSRSPAPLAPGSASTSKYSASVRSKSPAPTKIHNLNEIDDLEAVVSRMSQQANALPPKRIFKSTASCDPIKGVTGQIPINSKGLNESFSNGEVTDEEPTNKPVSERLAKWNKKVSETDTTSDSGPSSPMKLCPSSPTKPGVNQNLSSRLALLEKNLSASPSSPVKINKPVTPSNPTSTTAIKKDSSVTYKSEPSAVNTVVMRVKENKNRRESFEPTRESVSKRMADWQKKVAAVENTKEKEPTAYPVNARMSAWEKVTSAGSAPSDKMIKPLGNVLPTGGRPPSTSVPFVPKSPTANRKVEVSPVECDSGAKATLSPAKASCAMKAIHQRLLESQNQNTTHSLAEKIRQERMAELKAIENRWQNGLLKEHCVTNSDVESVSNEPTTNCNSSSPNSGRPLSTGNQSGMPPPPPPPPLPPISSDTYNMPATATVPPPPPPPPMTASAGPTSIFKLITSSQPSSIKNSNNPMTTKNVVKQVRFEDSFESSDDYSESAGNLYQSDDYSSENEAERTLEARQDLNSPEEEVDDTYSSSEENGGSLAARASTNMAGRSYMDSESDDVSISAFVPEAVRQQCKLSLQTESCSNILALARKQQQQKILDDNNCSFDSMDDFAQPTCQDTTDDSEESTSEGLSVDDALDEALEMDTTTTDDDRAMEKTPTNQSSANKRGSHYLATCTDSCFDDESTSDDNVVMRNRSPLMYSISMYRSKRFSNNSTPVQKIIRNSRPVTTEEELESESCEEKPREDSRKAILHRIKELNNQISLEQTVILQTSNALNHCCTEGSTFNGSAQQVECHKLLLIACQKRRAYLTEIQRLKDTNQLNHLGHGTRGTLTVSDIRLPLKKDFVSKMTTVHDLNVFYYVILLRNGPQVFATQLMSTHDPMVRGSLDFPNMIKLNNITAKFEISLELYEMKLCKEKLKDKKKKTKKCKGIASSQVSSYPSGLSDIHTSSFSLTWSVVLTMKSIDKTSFTMERVPYESPLIGSIYLRMKCIMETNVSERGFLTMFEDVSGLGAWHRRWCVLNGNKLKFWKYPDDENRKDPIGYIDLKRCITEKVGLISRDVCARPNTFEMCTVRPLRPGEEDTLTTRKHTTMATIRHMLSADTKEERILWCNKVNQALDNIRAWQPDALRPIRMANQAI